MSTRGENEEWGERKRERRECEEKQKRGGKENLGRLKKHVKGGGGRRE